MNLNRLSKDDLVQYFRGSVVNVPSERSVFYVTDIIGERGEWKFRGCLKDGTASSWGPSNDSVDVDDIDIVLPQPKVLQVKQFAIYSNRIPRRQWSRGLTGNNFRIQVIDEHFVYDMMSKFPNKFSTFGSDAPMVYYSAYYPSTAENIKEAINDIVAKKYLQRCLTKDFSLGVSPKASEFVLFYKVFPVGEVDSSGEIKMYDGFKTLIDVYQQQLAEGLVI